MRTLSLGSGKEQAFNWIVWSRAFFALVVTCFWVLAIRVIFVLLWVIPFAFSWYRMVI
jgi:hypothetical protein